jgi:Skp family chaperone for outer membrane proteins
MKNILFILFFFNFFFFKSIVIANNIAFIDLNYIINKSIEGKSVINKLENINKKNLDLLKKEQLSLNNERDDLEKSKNILSKEALNDRILLLNNKLKKFNEKQETLFKEFKNLKETEMSNLINKINPIIEKYMIDNNIDMMLKKDNIYISKSQYDVSNKLIELINSSFSN